MSPALASNFFVLFKLRIGNWYSNHPYRRATAKCFDMWYSECGVVYQWISQCCLCWSYFCWILIVILKFRVYFVICIYIRMGVISPPCEILQPKQAACSLIQKLAEPWRLKYLCRLFISDLAIWYCCILVIYLFCQEHYKVVSGFV